MTAPTIDATGKDSLTFIRLESITSPVKKGVLEGRAVLVAVIDDRKGVEELRLVGDAVDVVLLPSKSTNVTEVVAALMA